MNWTPVVISSVALIFTLFSFWWMNWRPGKLQVGGLKYFSAGKGREGSADDPNVVVVTLPLIFHNNGAQALVIESLRLTGVGREKMGVLDFEGVDSLIGIPPQGQTITRDYFILPLALKANEIIKQNFVFQRRTSEFTYTNALYHLHLEAKLSGMRKWIKIKDIELDFRNKDISLIGLNVGYQVFPYEPKL
jgi:hypothetical protein